MIFFSNLLYLLGLIIILALYLYHRFFGKNFEGTLSISSESLISNEMKKRGEIRYKLIKFLNYFSLCLIIVGLSRPQLIDSIKETIDNSNTVLWNGPAGYFENPNFENGTKKILEIITEKTVKNKIFSVAGGGETVAAINKFKKSDSFTFVSTAGGAFLEYLEGKTLPGIKALNSNVRTK